MRFVSMFRRVMLAALALCILTSMVAIAEISDFTFALNSSGDGYVVTGYSGSDAAVKVPDWYKKKPVTEIGAAAFQGNTTMTSVSLPSTIVRVGAGAFKNCPRLATITSYAAASKPPVLHGDADGNDLVEVNDVLLIMQYAAGWNVSVDTEAANVDNANGVNTADAVLILRYLAGEAVTLK